MTTEPKKRNRKPNPLLHPLADAANSGHTREQLMHLFGVPYSAVSWLLIDAKKKGLLTTVPPRKKRVVVALPTGVLPSHGEKRKQAISDLLSQQDAEDAVQESPVSQCVGANASKQTAAEEAP